MAHVRIKCAPPIRFDNGNMLSNCITDVSVSAVGDDGTAIDISEHVQAVSFKAELNEGVTACIRVANPEVYLEALALLEKP